MTVLLCDSGVWLAALDTADPHHVASREIFEAMLEGQVALGALDLTRYEVVNVAVARWHSADDARTLDAMVCDGAGDRLIAASMPMLTLAAEIGLEHGLSAYDAAYVATAQGLGWDLVSTDRRDLVEPGFAIEPGEALG